MLKKNRMTKDRLVYIAAAGAIGAVLGSGLGSASHHLFQGLHIGALAGVAVAVLVLLREDYAHRS